MPGSKVLLVDALEQAAAHGVTLSAGATKKPSGSGTRIPPGTVPDSVVGVAADTRLWLVGAKQSLSMFRGAVRAQLLDHRVLVDDRNMADPSTWGVEATPVASISAIGRSIVTDPEIAQQAANAIQTVESNPMYWASGDTWTAIVARENAHAAEVAIHDVLL